MESAVNKQVELDFTATKFDGSDYDPDRDQARMSEAMGRVFEVMIRDPEQYWSLRDLAKESEVPQSSVGSYLCYLRRDYFYTVPKKHVENGLYLYKLGRRFNEDEILERKAKKIKPVGDKELFGEMMRSIYAYAHLPLSTNLDAMVIGTEAWRNNFINKIRSGEDA